MSARELELHDGGSIASATFASGSAGQVTVNADRLLVASDGATAFTGIASSAELGSTGAGGAVNIWARDFLLRDDGAVTTESAGPGPDGPISITAMDTLRLDNAAIRAQTVSAKGGNVALAVGRLFDLHDSDVTTSVAGGTGSGGNIFINSHLMNPPLMVLDNSRIQANAQRGAGGNITIQAGQLIRTPDSKIQASSELELSGTISLAAPNTDIAGSLVVLPGTLFEASSELREACAARGGRPTSSLAPRWSRRSAARPWHTTGRQPLRAAAEAAYRHRIADDLDSETTAKPRQAAKPITVSGIPQPVLGSPRLTCRG